MSVVERVKNTKVLEVKEKNDTEAKVKVSADGINLNVKVKKIDGRWYLSDEYPF